MIPSPARRQLPPSSGGSRWTVWLAAGGIAGAALLAYSNTFSVPFFFDDLTAIIQNPSIRRLSALGEVLRPPANGNGVTGRPLVNLSLAVNYAWGGTAVGGYHAFNLLLHVLAGLTLFGIVRRVALLPSVNFDGMGMTGGSVAKAATPLAACTALLWVLHPLQTESVTSVIQRTELLVGLFYLLTFYGFVRSVEGGVQRRWAAVSCAACVCGMASKEVMVSAPVLVWFFDRTFVAGSFRAAWSQRWKYYLGLAATWLVLAALVAGTGGSRGTAAGFGLGVSWWSYSLKQCEAIWVYLRLAAWPHPLVADYGTEVVTRLSAVAVPAAGLLLLVGGTVFATMRRPVPGFLGLWFFAILAPSSSVVPLVTQTMAEHRMYLPLAAVLALITFTVFNAAGWRGLLALGAAAVILGGLSFRRNEVYHSELRLWSDTVVHSPRAARVQVNLGVALKRLGRDAEALKHYQTALTLDPNLASAHSELGSIMIKQGRLAEARQAFETALRLNPWHPEALNNLGIIEAELGQPDAAARRFEAALTIQPRLAPAHSNLAGILINRGQWAEAQRHAEIAATEEPQLADAPYNLGRVKLAQGRPAEAIPLFERAVSLRPDYAEAHHHLGVACFQTRQTAKAIEQFATAVRLGPRNAEAHNNLGSALFQAGRVIDAEQSFRAAIAVNPAMADAHCNLAIALAHLGKPEAAVAEYEAALRLNPNHALARHGLANLQPMARTPAAKP